MLLYRQRSSAFFKHSCFIHWQREFFRISLFEPYKILPSFHKYFKAIYRGEDGKSMHFSCLMKHEREFAMLKGMTKKGQVKEEEVGRRMLNNKADKQTNKT
jgi:hypothetical protein